MSLWTLLFVYVLGGLTFLPLTAIAFVAGLIYLSPPLDDPAKEKLVATTSTTPEPEKTPLPAQPPPKTIQGWLIVRRTFEEPPDNASYVGNLMRSLYDNSKSSISSNSSHPRRPKDRFYAVLKGTVLYLYEDEAGTEAYAALQIAAYDVEIYPDTQRMTDGELYAKRNSIRLKGKKGTTPLISKQESLNEEGGAVREPSPHRVSDEHFLFVKSAILMEDWYFALINATAADVDALSAGADAASLSSLEPVFSTTDMAHLVRTLDQQSDPIPMRWLNALVGRIFFSLYKTAALEANLIARIMKKIAKVPRPAFLTEIVVREVNVGNTAPFFSKPMLKELTKEGDASVEMGLSYKAQEGAHSGVRITVEATVTIDIKDSLPMNLGTRFDLKPRTVKLILAIVLRSLDGNVLLRVKRPPSNRIWWGFTSMPKMEMELLPIVSDRKIKWGMVLKPIENLVREVIQESVVLPYMDDIPFFDSENKARRGGIFADAVRSVYDFEAPSAPATTVSDDGAAQINTISPSNTIPTSAHLTTGNGGLRTPDSIGDLSLPGSFNFGSDQTPIGPSSRSSSPSLPFLESPAPGTPVSRTSTQASGTSLSSATKRKTWLPRFTGRHGSVSEADEQLKPRTSMNLRERVVEDRARGSRSVSPAANAPVEPGPRGSTPTVKADQPGPDSETKVVNEAEASLLMSNGHVATNVDELGFLDTSPASTTLGSLEANRERAKSSTGIPQPVVGVSSPSIRTRSPTVNHHPSQSAAAVFYSPQTKSIKPEDTMDVSSRPEPQPSDSVQSDTTITPSNGMHSSMSASMSSEDTPDITESPPRPKSTEPAPSDPQSTTAAQTLLTAWKNRGTDKQVLAATARDVARDAMKKWGFGAKKNSETSTSKSQPVAAETSSINDRPKPSSPETKAKTYNQLKAEFAQRHDSEIQRRRASSTSPDADVFIDSTEVPHPAEIVPPKAASERRGSQHSGVLNVTPARPAAAQVHMGSQNPLTTMQNQQPIPPPLPPRGSNTDVDDRLRKVSTGSQPGASPVIPVRRQPGQGASMQIPGIHASHRGEVMALGFTPNPPPSPPMSPPQIDPPNGNVGAKAAPLQTVYRLFNRTGALNSNSAPNVVDPSNDVQNEELVTQSDDAPLRPPPLPARKNSSQKPLDTTPQPPLGTTPANDNVVPSAHQRVSSNSSASEALKQIQAKSGANSRRSSIVVGSLHTGDTREGHIDTSPPVKEESSTSDPVTDDAS